MISIKRMSAVLATIVAVALVFGCGGDDDVVPGQTQVHIEDFATPAGYWEGSGTATHTPWDDAVRHFYRSADYEFWFALDTDGNASGEVTLTYDAKLTIEGLPDFSAPAPGGINVSFEPEVGGELSDSNPIRTLPLIGYYDEEDNVLILHMVQSEDDEPMKFTLRADPGVSAAVPLDAFGEQSSDDVEAGDLPGDPGTNEGDVGEGDDGEGESVDISDPGFLAIVRVYDMVPFTPFSDSDEAPVEKRTGGPHEVSFEYEGNDYVISWTAQQKSADVQTVELDPAMRQALQDIVDGR
jgi:hypothetical protein